jgi:hypothetical protein
VQCSDGIYTELQCGSYIFMDADYGRNRDRDGEPFKTFEPSLYDSDGPCGNVGVDGSGVRKVCETDHGQHDRHPNGLSVW